MHVPNPLGGVPLILRDVDTKNLRKGELLLDYTSSDLYFVDKETGQKERLADSIYKSIVDAKVENSKILITCSDGGSEAATPAIEDRKMNQWFVNIVKREEQKEETASE